MKVPVPVSGTRICTSLSARDLSNSFCIKSSTYWLMKSTIGTGEGEENFVGDSEIIALGGASNETKDRPLG